MYEIVSAHFWGLIGCHLFVFELSHQESGAPEVDISAKLHSNARETVSLTFPKLSNSITKPMKISFKIVTTYSFWGNVLEE